MIGPPAAAFFASNSSDSVATAWSIARAVSTASVAARRGGSASCVGFAAALIGNLHAALEQLDERGDPLIPEREVREHAGHRPAVWHRATQSRVVELADERFEAATFAIVFGDVRAIGCHRCPPAAVPAACQSLRQRIGRRA
jgi:hypothetical protein